jgi:hypothetical protein
MERAAIGSYGRGGGVLRRTKIFLTALGVAGMAGMVLLIVLDFGSQVSPFSGVSKMLRETGGGIGYALAASLALALALVPLDTYFFVWGTEILKDVGYLVPLQLLLYFALVGASIGLRSRSVADAAANGALFVLGLALLILALVLVLSETLLGPALLGVLEGATGRDLPVLVVCSVLENGTCTAIFSAFAAALASPADEIGACEIGGVCEI